MKTLAQKHADAALEDAVTRTIEAYGLLAPGHTMIEYIVLIEGLDVVNEESEERESLALAFRNGVARTSVALGLTQLANNRLNPSAAFIIQNGDGDG